MNSDRHPDGAAILQAAASRPGSRFFRALLKQSLKNHWRPVIKGATVSCEGCDWSAPTMDSTGKASYRYIRHVAWLVCDELGVEADDFGTAVAFLSDALRDHRPYRHPEGSHCRDKQCSGMVFTSANKASNHQCDAVVAAVYGAAAVAA